MKRTFHLGDLDSPDVAALLSLHFASMRANSPADACHVLPQEDLRSPTISFWSMRQHGQLQCIGALQHLNSDHGEVKSMRAAPEVVGRGAGKAMLDHLIAEARNRGYRRLSLETGSTAMFAPALRLYEREGFIACGPFGRYHATPFTRFMTREI